MADQRQENRDLGDYVRLAEITQSSFNGRRSAEWKIKFAFWGAIGVAFYAIDQRRDILVSSALFVLLLAAIISVFVIYVVFELVFQRANMTDKEWKHYYMGRAEGMKGGFDRPREGLVSWWRPLVTLWFWAYFFFTLVLVLLLIGYVMHTRASMV